MMAETEPRVSQYFHSKGIRLGLPVSGTFELTRRCNFDCKMCYVHTTNTANDRELTTEEWLELAETAKKNGMLFLLLTGGEPLLRKDFPVLYESLAQMGFIISINSNGSLITDEILSLFDRYPPCRINISLYGGSEEIYENLCGNRKFGVVRENIQKLKARGISVRLNCTFNRYNVTEIERIYQIASELDVVVKPSSYMYPPLRAKGETGGNDARLTSQDAAKANLLCRRLTYSEDAMREKAKQLMRLEPPDCGEEEGEGVRCRAGRSTFWVTFDGRMLPCGMMTEPVVSLRETPFEEAWKIIREKTAEIRLPKACRTCKNKEICNVCAAMCYTETGSFNEKPQYICDMIDAIVEEYKSYHAE